MRSPLFRAIRLLVLLALGATLPGCGHNAGDPVQSANAFFMGISQGRIEETYKEAAFGFQASQNLKSFEATAKDLGLAGTVACEWPDQKVKADEVKLDGEITRRDGVKSPVSVTMIKERGMWRVFALRTLKKDGDISQEENKFTLVGKGASFSNASNREVPSLPVLRKLVEENLVLFNDAVQQKSFTYFYETVSVLWQQQLTQKQLQRAFQPFIDAGVNIGNIRVLTPEFDSTPEVNSEGLLLLKGHYPTKPYRVEFSLRFTYELPNWKLFGIDVQLRQ